MPMQPEYAGAPPGVVMSKALPNFGPCRLKDQTAAQLGHCGAAAEEDDLPHGEVPQPLQTVVIVRLEAEDLAAGGQDGALVRHLPPGELVVGVVADRGRQAVPGVLGPAVHELRLVPGRLELGREPLVDVR